MIKYTDGEIEDLSSRLYGVCCLDVSSYLPISTLFYSIHAPHIHNHNDLHSLIVSAKDQPTLDEETLKANPIGLATTQMTISRMLSQRDRILSGETDESDWAMVHVCEDWDHQHSHIKIYNIYDHFYDILFTVKLEDVPLLMEDTVVGFFAKWRLEIGK